MDFAQATLEELNSLVQDDVNKLSNEEFLQYCKCSVELGNSYYVGGLMEGYDQGDPVGWVNGTRGKVLRQNEEGKWYVAQSMFTPDYRIRPVMMDRERFATEMGKLGVPEGKLEEFLAFEPHYDGF